jgi:hypothetical protein
VVEACPPWFYDTIRFSHASETRLCRLDDRRIHKVELLHRPGDPNGSKYPAQFSHTLAGNVRLGLRLLPQHRRRFDTAADRIEHVG